LRRGRLIWWPTVDSSSPPLTCPGGEWTWLACTRCPCRRICMGMGCLLCFSWKTKSNSTE
jgi:hypothetical protein